MFYLLIKEVLALQMTDTFHIFDIVEAPPLEGGGNIPSFFIAFNFWEPLFYFKCRWLHSLPRTNSNYL